MLHNGPPVNDAAGPRVAIVHDGLINLGGAERVVTHLRSAFPAAPIYTSAYLPEATYPSLRSAQVITLPGGQWPRTEQQAKRLLPLWLWGFRRLDLRGFDVVLVSSTWAAKYVRPPGGTRFACFCHAPFRWLWYPHSYADNSLPLDRRLRRLLEPGRWLLRRLDHAATRAIPSLAAPSANAARLIADCYQRTAQVIHSPIRVADFTVTGQPGRYYLVVARHISHKRLDLAIAACERLGRELIVVGDGPERPALARLAGPHTRLVGRVSEAELRQLYAECRAVIFPSDEDFGLVPLEAQASGRPVIAYGTGGVLETLVPEETGLCFGEQTVDAVVDALTRFERMDFDAERIRRNAARFDVGPFVDAIRAFALNAGTRQN